jgi:polyamine oxidase
VNLTLILFVIPGLFGQHIDGQNASPPSVIVIGGGISGIASARALSNASFKVNYLWRIK